MPPFAVGFLATFIGSFILMSLFLQILRLLGVYVIVEEKQCFVYTLFGKVVGVIDEPGISCLWTKLGLAGFVVNWLGRRYVVDMRLDQQYLRSQPVNSEEGAPMGIGIWYEMFVSDPTAYLFKNVDPRGSLAANVSNSVVRCLSNMPLDEMLVNRHAMSQTVRSEVSAKSQDWGYKLGSVYIRKVHFRDSGMIRQIEAKVVNRLRQVTAAIKQEGDNQVKMITSAADRQAAIQLGVAAARRPAIVGAALARIGQDPEIAHTLFEILETQKVVEGKARVTLTPEGTPMLQQLLAAGPNAGEPAGAAERMAAQPAAAPRQRQPGS